VAVNKKESSNDGASGPVEYTVDHTESAKMPGIYLWTVQQTVQSREDLA
jgi:hypothetical protein